MKLIQEAGINYRIPYDVIEEHLNNFWRLKLSLLERPTKSNINFCVETRFKFLPDIIVIIKRSIQYFFNRLFFKYHRIRPAINFLQNNPNYFSSLIS